MAMNQVGTGTLTLRVTTHPAPTTSYRQLVMGLAGAVAQVPAGRLAEHAGVLEPLRTAVRQALVAVEAERVVLYGALARLAACLEGAANGQMPGPDRLSLALMGTIRAIGEEPAGAPTVTHALERVTGVVAAVSGRLACARI